MSNLREAFAASAMACLDWSPLREKAIDRVAASGRIEPLGVWLWKAKYQLEADAYKRAQSALSAAYGRRYRDSEQKGAALVSQAMREYLAPSCRVCHGVGEMMVNELRVICATCDGSKIHRYSDVERAQTMQLSYSTTKASAHKLHWVLGVMGNEDRKANAVMMRELRDSEICT